MIGHRNVILLLDSNPFVALSLAAGCTCRFSLWLPSNALRQGSRSPNRFGEVAEVQLREQLAPSESVDYWPLAIDLP